MIDVKQAVRSAFQYLHDVYDEKTLSNARLEETELSEAGDAWLVTIGFDREVEERPPFIPSALALPRVTRIQREYKIFRVRADNGEVQAMKIRKVS